MNSDEPSELRISFQDGDYGDMPCIETTYATQIGPNLYRMEVNSFEYCFHDVIEAEPQPDGTVRFVRIVTRSGLTTRCWILSFDPIKRPGLKLLLEKVMAVGGYWESICGGILVVNLPPAEARHLTRKLLDQFRRDALSGSAAAASGAAIRTGILWMVVATCLLLLGLG